VRSGGREEGRCVQRLWEREICSRFVDNAMTGETRLPRPPSLPPSPPPILPLPDSRSPSLRRTLTRQASFMVFKTWLSFLALLGKASQFRVWDEKVLEGRERGIKGGREGGREGFEGIGQ